MGYFDDADAKRAQQAEQEQAERLRAEQEKTARRAADYQAFVKHDLPQIITDYVHKAAQIRPPRELRIAKQSYWFRPTYNVEAWLLWNVPSDGYRGGGNSYYVDKNLQVYSVQPGTGYPLSAQPIGGLNAAAHQMAGPQAGFDKAVRAAQVVDALRGFLEN